jgi:AraC-like DNA-binding protein
VNGADVALYRILEREIRDADTRSDAPFGERLGHLVRTAMATGEVSLERVASLLSMRPRTLNRRLQQHGTTFKQVADAARYAMSQQMLARSDARLIDIAASLGYADASAFTRAFRRWAGVTPTEWRRRSVASPS